MDFLVCRYGLRDYSGVVIYTALEDVEDQEQAVTEAKKIAQETREGATVALFTRNGNEAICGWKVKEGGRLKNEDVQAIKDACRPGIGAFELAKRQAKEMKSKSAR
jgi:translation initiation factor IF-2